MLSYTSRPYVDYVHVSARGATHLVVLELIVPAAEDLGQVIENELDCAIAVPKAATLAPCADLANKMREAIGVYSGRSFHWSAHCQCRV